MWFVLELVWMGPGSEFLNYVPWLVRNTGSVPSLSHFAPPVAGKEHGGNVVAMVSCFSGGGGEWEKGQKEFQGRQLPFGGGAPFLFAQWLTGARGGADTKKNHLT
jgi:hypothetical protein